MDKIRSLRSNTPSNNWKKAVLARAGVEWSKAIEKAIFELWQKGYSHKDAGLFIKRFMGSEANLNEI